MAADTFGGISCGPDAEDTPKELPETVPTLQLLYLKRRRAEAIREGLRALEEHILDLNGALRKMNTSGGSESSIMELTVRIRRLSEAAYEIRHELRWTEPETPSA